MLYLNHYRSTLDIVRYCATCKGKSELNDHLLTQSNTTKYVYTIYTNTIPFCSTVVAIAQKNTCLCCCNTLNVCQHQSEGSVAIIMQTKQTLTVQTPADTATSKLFLAIS